MIRMVSLWQAYGKPHHSVAGALCSGLDRQFLVGAQVGMDKTPPAGTQSAAAMHVLDSQFRNSSTKRMEMVGRPKNFRQFFRLSQSKKQSYDL